MWLQPILQECINCSGVQAEQNNEQREVWTQSHTVATGMYI